MSNLSAEIREESNEKARTLRKEGKLPVILYGPKIKNLSLEMDYKDFNAVYKEAGESSLISLKVRGKQESYKVLIHDFQRDPLSGKFIHVDLYQPSLKEKIEAKIPLVFEGESEAVKNLGGTLVRDITEIEVKALPQELPHEIKVNIEKLKTFDDHIKVSDLKVSGKVEVMKESEEIIASVVPPEKMEEELKKPTEEEAEKTEEVQEKEEEKEKGEEKSKES